MLIAHRHPADPTWEHHTARRRAELDRRVDVGGQPDQVHGASQLVEAVGAGDRAAERARGHHTWRQHIIPLVLTAALSHLDQGASAAENPGTELGEPVGERRGDPQRGESLIRDHAAAAEVWQMGMVFPPSPGPR